MKRGGPLKRDPEKAREWQARSVARSRDKARDTARVIPRTRLPRTSKRRASMAEARAECRAICLARSRDSCELAAVIPEVDCAFYGGRGLEVDEIRGGSYRSTEMLDPERCRVTCPAHHDWKTANKTLYRRRIGDL